MEVIVVVAAAAVGIYLHFHTATLAAIVLPLLGVRARHGLSLHRVVFLHRRATATGFAHLVGHLGLVGHLAHDSLLFECGLVPKIEQTRCRSAVKVLGSR